MRINGMVIRKLIEKDLPPALDLVWAVFSHFEAPEYTQEGIDVFRDFIDLESIRRMEEAGVLLFYGAFEKDRIVGVIAVRGLSHISLLFVDPDYHRRGVARALFSEIQRLVRANDLSEITVNSSPFAVDFYKKVGFRALSPELEKQGIRYTPMSFSVPAK
jgi:GNAT superfamily N-acetyltransferase